MFPTAQDLEEFRAQFGPESVIDRMQIPRRDAWGTQVAATVVPSPTKEETLRHAWSLARSLARWVLARAHELTTDERCIVIVGWSRSVRPLQGQIFKMGGSLDILATLAKCADWQTAQKTPGQQIPLTRWEKDVFAEPGAAPNGGPAEPLGNSGLSGGPPSVS
jgi:hypothetical protein